MRSFKPSRPLPTIATLLLLVTATGTRAAGKAQATSSQAATQVVFTVTGDSADAPVHVTKILVGDRPITPGQAVPVSGEWVGKIKIFVKNVSGRTVIAGTVHVLFPETGDGTLQHPLLTSGSNLGRVPALAFRRRDGTSMPVPPAFAQQPEARVAPGDTAVFEIGEAQGRADQSEAYRRTATITAITIQAVNFYFEDGSKWTGITYFVPVPPPALWKAITPQEFFGTKASLPNN